MSFDLNKFQDAKFTHRSEKIKVEELSAFFDGEAIITVRGLSGPEVALCNDAVQSNKNLKSIVTRLLDPLSSEKAGALIEALALDPTKSTDDFVRRLSLAFHGIVEPKLPYESIVRLAEFYSATFYEISNKILQLTGQGAELGE
jgi:predicted flavoprotein YhiN